MDLDSIGNHPQITLFQVSDLFWITQIECIILAAGLHIFGHVFAPYLFGLSGKETVGPRGDSEGGFATGASPGINQNKMQPTNPNAVT